MAGEKVVIASLVIDETGAVRAIQQTTAAQTGLERQTRQTADVFTQRMFSMRSAAQAFLGSFTLAGGVFALKGLAEEAIRADKHFASISVSATNLRNAMAGMAAEMLNLDKTLPGIESAMNSMATYLREEAAAHKALREGKMSTMDYIRGRSVPVEEFIGPPTPAGIGTLGYDPDASAKAFKELQARKQEVIENASSLNEYSLASIEAASSVAELNRVIEQQGILVKGTAEAFAESAAGIQDITLNQVETANATARLSLTLSEMGMVAQAAGQALGTFAADGTKGMARMIAQVLGFVAALAWSRVATYSAAAVAASTGVGAAIEGGTPAQFAVSAALWKKVALVSTFAAAALGSYSSGGAAGGGGEARGGFGGVDVSGSSGRPQQQVTVIVNGSVVTVRDLVEEIKDALSDGVVGGKLVTA